MKHIFDEKIKAYETDLFFVTRHYFISEDEVDMYGDNYKFMPEIFVIPPDDDAIAEEMPRALSARVGVGFEPYLNFNLYLDYSEYAFYACDMPISEIRKLTTFS